MSVMKSRSLKTVLLMTAMALSWGAASPVQAADYYSYNGETLTYGGQMRYGGQVVSGQQLSDNLPENFGHEPVLQTAAVLPAGGYAIAVVQPSIHRVPVRAGALDIREDDIANGHVYTISFNGQVLLTHEGPRSAMHVSPSFRMSEEDVVIFSFTDNRSSCPYSHFLVVVRDDGTAPVPRAINSCGPLHDARGDVDTLRLSFPATGDGSSWTAWEEWKYHDSVLTRL